MLIPETKATTDFPIHELLAERWSPDVFQDRMVLQADLRSLFEAARWAPKPVLGQIGAGAGTGRREFEVDTQR